METNPLNHGALTESGAGIGPVSRKMIRERATEIGLINGHPASEVTLTEWDQAKRELTGGPTIGPKTALLLSAPEADRWNPVPGSPGHQAPVSGSEEEDAEGRNEAAQLFEEGVGEAAHDYWRAANYLSVGQIYLLEPAAARARCAGARQAAPARPLGHDAGLNFIYAHLNRVIREHDLDVIYVTGPGHGGPALVANTYLEGTYSEVYPDITQDAEGMQRLFRSSRSPAASRATSRRKRPARSTRAANSATRCRTPSARPSTIPDLIVACVVGDGEAETGPLAASWHSNKFLNPVRDGAVLPILHLNGYKIANPTVLARISRDELDALLRGYGYEPHFVEGDDPRDAPAWPRTLDAAWTRSGDPARGARVAGFRGPAALADDRPAHAQGLDRAEDGRRQAGRGHLALAPGADGRHAQNPGICAAARGVAAQLPPGGAVRRDGRCARARRARADRPRRMAPIRTPTAACCCGPAPARLPRLRGEVPAPARAIAEATRVLGSFCAT
jgi:hypothetical protein